MGLKVPIEKRSYSTDALTLGTKTSSTDGYPNPNNIFVTELERQERVARGQCQTCGQQLYHLRTYEDSFLGCCLGKAAKSATRKLPLSVPMLVHRGQCLKCLERATNKDCAAHKSDKTHGTQPDDSSSIDHLFESPSTNNAPKTIRAASPHLKTNSSFEQHMQDKEGGARTPSNTTARYDGPFNARGEKHGEGSMVWSNGDVYKGSFVNDQRNGHGTLTFGTVTQGGKSIDKGEYVGEWKNNHMHGNGTRRYPNGDVYVGDYRNGQRHGEGRFYYSNGDLYHGQWDCNQMSGKGRYYYSSGVRFEGTFSHGRRNGKGKTEKTDGTLDVFQFINDERVGQGVRWNKNRSMAWRLWMPRNSGVSQPGVAVALQKQRVSIAEAASLLHEIEVASNEAD